MTNLEIIKAAAGMGYSAVLKYKELDLRYKKNKVVFIEKNAVRLQDGSFLLNKDLKHYEIIDYIYCGHLFGEPVIPEGQIFRVKKNGAIIDSSNPLHFSLLTFYKKEELEPVFD